MMGREEENLLLDGNVLNLPRVRGLAPAVRMPLMP